MPTTLPPVLLQAPVVERETLRLTRVWSQWFTASYIRQGGNEAATNTELAGGVVANADHISAVEEGLGTTNTTLAGLEAEVTVLQQEVLTLRADVDALTTRVETLEATAFDQETRLAALEAWKEAMQAALPAVVSVTAVPALTNDPATAILLENDLSANWRPPVNANDAGLATAVNAVLGALALAP